MAEKYFSVGEHDTNARVAPDIGTPFTDATNSVTTHRIPRRDGVGPDVLQRNGTQTKTQSADLHAVSGEAIVKAAPGQCRHRQQDQCRQGQDETYSGQWNHPRYTQLNPHKKGKDRSPER